MNKLRTDIISLGVDPKGPPETWTEANYMLYPVYEKENRSLIIGDPIQSTQVLSWEGKLTFHLLYSAVHALFENIKRFHGESYALVFNTLRIVMGPGGPHLMFLHEEGDILKVGHARLNAAPGTEYETVLQTTLHLIQATYKMLQKLELL